MAAPNKIKVQNCQNTIATKWGACNPGMVFSGGFDRLDWGNENPFSSSRLMGQAQQVA
jgi:hypothetical protein